jgi:hypothetical protein
MKFKIILLCFLAKPLLGMAQDDFEIQVYESETMDPGATMFELHSNHTYCGPTTSNDGTLPGNSQTHETLEITHGWNSWFETGFYFFNAAAAGATYVETGSHLRPRVRVPMSWNWPVGVSMSMEVGYMSPKFSADTWDLELRPIIDKQFKRLYVAINPVFDKSLHGPNVNKGFDFVPSSKIGYNVTKKMALGVEYYGETGFLATPAPITAHHQLFAAADLDVVNNMEINFGYGHALTEQTNNRVFKVILGYKVTRRVKPAANRKS